MRIAVATDQDFVASGFGCCPACTIVNVEDGRIRETLVIPNPGCHHAFWAELFFRNAIKFVIAGSMGQTAKSVLRGWGITPILGVEGQIDDVVRRFSEGELHHKGAGGDLAQATNACCDYPA